MEAAAPNLASAGLSANAGLSEALAASAPQSPIPASYSPSLAGGLTAGQAGSGPQAGGAAAVPEPGTMALLIAAALCGLGAWLRRRSK